MKLHEKKIYLYWYKYKKGNGNFGDELNPYIFGKLTTNPIKYINVKLLWNNRFLAFKILTVNFLQKKIRLSTFLIYFYYNFFRPEICLAIGSVLHLCKYNRTLVWGSGIIKKDIQPPNATFLAVRGPATIKRLKELGMKTSRVVGDPALLLPILYPKNNKPKRYKMGIIPHYIHYNKFRKFLSEDILIINLLDSIEEILDQIMECEITFSTSLHGIIVSHAYEIPAVWVTDKKELSGDDIKFEDYFSSVNITKYKPIDSALLSNDLVSNLKLTKKIDSDFLLPNIKSIRKIQENLLNTFPYKFKSEIERDNF